MVAEFEITERHLAEWIQLAFVSLLAIAAWLRPLSRSRRLIVSTLAFIAIGAIVLARLSAQWLTPAASAVLRDCVPAAILLVPYWQVGQFFTRADPRTEMRLAAFDRTFFRRLGSIPGTFQLTLRWVSICNLPTRWCIPSCRLALQLCTPAA